MSNVIVSVKLREQPREYDLEVPSDVPAQKLAELIIHNLDPTGAIRDTLSVQFLRPGITRTLTADETLADAGLWDGAFLEIGPAGSTSAAVSRSWMDIVVQWEPLGLGVPDGQSRSGGGWVAYPPAPDPSPSPMPPPPLPTPGPTQVDPSGFEPLFTDEELRRLGLKGGPDGTDAAGDNDRFLPLM